MKTITLKIPMPDRDDMIRGLKQASDKAERIAAEATRTVDETRKALAVAEKLVSELPDRIRHGEVAAKKLTEALEKRDATKQRLEVATAEANQAKERAAIEAREVAAERQRDLDGRAKLLEDAIAVINPILIEVRERERDLAAADGRGGVYAIEWCESPHSLMGRRQ